MRYSFIIILLLAVNACNHKQQNSNTNNTFGNKNDSILITYDCGLVSTPFAVHCEKLASIQEHHPKNQYINLNLKEKDASIKDNNVLNGIRLKQIPIGLLIDTFIVDKTITSKIIRLLDNKVNAPDFKEDARMYVTIKKTDGSIDFLCFDHFPDRVKYNGQSCSIDKELLFLLRYYSGYYSWFEENNLKRFEELKDTLLYQKALEQIKLREK